MLVLLRRMHRYPQVQRNLARFVQRYSQRHSLSELERSLVETGAEPVIEHFTAARKKLMFSTYFALIHATPYLAPAEIAQVHYEQQASWVRLTLCAIKIINAYGVDQPALVSAQDRSFLLDQLAHGSAREVWEGNLSAHLLGLLALQTFAPHHPLLVRGVHALLDQRNPDGGLPFITHMTVYLTAFAGLALAKTGKRSAVLRRMGDYLVAEQAADGAWPYSENVRQTDIDSTCMTIEYLVRIDPQGYAPSIERGRQYLAGMANADGGFATYLRHHPSEATMTANVMIALAPDWPLYRGVLNAAQEFLATAQQPDGSFERSWSLSATFAIARVACALAHPAACSGALMARSMAYLQRTQNADGGWGQAVGQRSDVISSAHALSALSYGADSLQLRRGLSYLKRHRGRHSQFHAPPDQAAPRPIPYQFPVLAQIFVLNALGDVAKRLTCASSRPPGGAGGTSLPHGRGTAACNRSRPEYHGP